MYIDYVLCWFQILYRLVMRLLICQLYLYLLICSCSLHLNFCCGCLLLWTFVVMVFLTVVQHGPSLCSSDPCEGFLWKKLWDLNVFKRCDLWTWNTCIIAIAHVEVCTDLNKIDLLVLSSSEYFGKDVICDDAKMFFWFFWRNSCLFSMLCMWGLWNECSIFCELLDSNDQIFWDEERYLNIAQECFFFSSPYREWFYAHLLPLDCQIRAKCC